MVTPEEEVGGVELLDKLLLVEIETTVVERLLVTLLLLEAAALVEAEELVLVDSELLIETMVVVSRGLVV